ncbi:hypothetical protein H2200_011694 [Cladophialophora chaetospira]|uniref:Uncharacterized protein n=1 Tax=Cladophialophora chaetospira TaxID=386627 RepID=A0AA38WYM3_9EURO|nr:hypothetical protein H2200_011694 [Cladophialophora chaetospira]
MFRLPILSDPSKDSSEDLPAAESKTPQHDGSASLLALNGYRLPADIVFVILSYFVPGNGLQVSNDPAYDSDLLHTRGDIIPKLKFIFQDPTKEHPEYQSRELRLWEMNMMLEMLMAWRWTECEDVFHQIKFPPSIVVAAWNFDESVPPPLLLQTAFPHDPHTYLAALQESISLWWARKLTGDKWRASLVRDIMTRLAYYYIDWYLTTVPLKANSISRTIFNVGVLKINAPSTELGGKPATIRPWTGEFIATDN